MNTYWSRLSQLTSVYIFALCICGFWTYLGGKVQEWSIGLDDTRSLKPISLMRVEKFASHPATHSDAATLLLSLNMDLRPAFTWSTKALYVYVSVDYETAYRSRNEVVIWDRIITTKEAANVVLKESASKYFLQDYSRGHMFNQPIRARLHYYQFPKTGFFHKFDIGEQFIFEMPGNYTYRGRIRP